VLYRECVCGAPHPGGAAGDNKGFVGLPAGRAVFVVDCVPEQWIGRKGIDGIFNEREMTHCFRDRALRQIEQRVKITGESVLLIR
jgi:hypothetical protein